jgi:uncharacterized protein
MNTGEPEFRFYPEFYPEFTCEPTRDRFRIIPTENTGEGIISLASFRRDELLFKFAGVLLDEMTLFTLQLRPGMHLHDPFFMGKILHSCDPNMICDIEARTFTALRDIEPGEFLTMDYETTEDVLYRPFHCRCGSINCRGYIEGREIRIHRMSDAMTEVPSARQVTALP